MEKKKVFICYSAESTNFFVKVILKQLKLEEASEKENADFLVVELKRPCYGFNENNLEKLNEKPAVILTTQNSSYQKEIFNHLAERGIENKKLIVEIPNSYLDVVEKFKKILQEE